MPTLDISNLLEHQKRGLRFLMERKGIGCLFQSAGAGKSLIVLKYLEALARKHGKVTALVVAPLAAVASWPQEAAKWLPSDVGARVTVLTGRLPERAAALAGGDWSRHTIEHFQPADGPQIRVAVVNIDTFSRRRSPNGDDQAAELLKAVKRMAPDVLVVDELHMLRAYSNRQRLLVRIAKTVPRRIGLTGTPQPKGLENIFRQLQVIDPTVFPYNYQTFLDTFCVLGRYPGEISAYKRLDEFTQMLATVAHVVKKEDVLDLPPTQDVVVPVVLSPKEQKVYNELKKELCAELDTGKVITVGNSLTKTLRLRQVALGYLPDEDGDAVSLGLSKIKAVADLVENTLAEEKRIVVFTNFQYELKQLHKVLRGLVDRVDVIDGATPASERLAIRERFGSASDERIALIAQTQTMSMGVNELTTAAYVIYTSLPLDRAQYDQSRARVDRQGQTRPVTYYLIEAVNTVDTAVRKAHQSRANLEAAITEYLRNS